MFTVIGERINMTRRRIREETEKRNADFIKNEAVRQARAGATHIDVNAGADPAREVDDMCWLVDTVAEAVDLPLSVDSANADAVRAGLERCNRPGTIINSINNEKARVASVMPLVVEFETRVIALTMDDSGMPEDFEGRKRITDDLIALFEKQGVGLDRVYFDHLVRPAGMNPGAAKDILSAIRYVKELHPETHIALGMSNISFGVPARQNLNLAFLAMLIEAGCDGAVLDPCHRGTMTMLYAAHAVTGADEYAMAYLTAHREGRLT